ncbi:amidohydrolase family protein [Belliella sp. R4-6]|uniref:Amidohydrolase family protein n=1 Tax=Belliella alkalica TaxID=1730871 RepID=A0ABS9V6C0_9BACT|nr:amidohydrolase family protein [Belliella alkalica]MCH7411961.1 amidohydrolase family protein [Belliella alkalica]
MSKAQSIALKLIITFLLFSFSVFAYATQYNQTKNILINQVNVFDGKSKNLLLKRNILIEGNKITKISVDPITVGENVILIDGTGKTIIPGLIDVHVHMIFGSLSMLQMASPDLGEDVIFKNVSTQSENMLLRGFTSVRDAGGPIFPLKKAIDEGQVSGPRIWPSGATISQTSGHGDMRLPHEKSRRFFGPISRAESVGATFIADGRDEVLTAVRENLREGASQIKIMAGGGTSSAYDPLDVTQYTFDEMKAAVDAAEDWGTYVTVHAYTNRAVQRAIKAGVKCVEHGQLLDKKTLKLMKRKGVWLSTQRLVDNTSDMDESRIIKRAPVLEGQQVIWPLAKKLKMKLAWGTDFLFEPSLMDTQNDYIVKLEKWFTPYEILKMVTHDNAQLLALSGLRSPYSGKLGVIEEGALADMILIDGNPLENIGILSQYADKFSVIIKDGKVVKNNAE